MSIRPGAVRGFLLACIVAVLGPLLLAPPASASTPAPRGHVIVIGLSGLRWSDVSASATPTLWRLAGQGSVGDLVDYAVKPLTCPADGWLTLNAGARAQSEHTNADCGAFPPVTVDGSGARVPGLAAIETYNQQFHNDPHWGLLAGSAAIGAAASGNSCTTAVGPGGALALAGADGHVSSYVPSAGEVTGAVLARCPLTVVDLGVRGSARTLAAADTELARILADAPAGSTVLFTAPGATAKPPHLQVAVVSGPGYRSGLLDAASTRQPGMVVLTDLNATVLGWLGRTGPADAVGAQITRGDRGSLSSAVASLTARDTAEQVWRSTHNAFFWTYALADAVALVGIGLAFWGAAEDRRRRRARWWRVAGVFAAAVPAGTFLANLVPWSSSSHPALALYTATALLSLVVALAALAAGRRLGALAPFGLICLFTLAVLGVDVMTGSRLQLETPFGLSVLEAGRFYGIGNEALGIYGISGLLAAGWLALIFLRRYPSSRRPALLALTVVAVFAVFASGWPGFGGKVGGTISMVPCFLLLGLAVAGVRLTWRRILLVAVSGLVLFALFALISYLVPALTGKSDIGAFAGSSLHGNSGGLLLRKINSNLGSLAVNAFSPLIPLVVVVSGLMLWRPAWFRLRTLPRAYAAEPPTGPLMPPLLWVLWLLPVLGWLADDSGVIVPAAVLPFALPLGIAVAATAAYTDHQARYRETTAPSASPATRK